MIDLSNRRSDRTLVEEHEQWRVTIDMFDVGEIVPEKVYSQTALNDSRIHHDPVRVHIPHPPHIQSQPSAMPNGVQFEACFTQQFAFSFGP